MSLRLRSPATGLQPEVGFGSGPTASPEEAATSRGVLVNYGIHRARFPIGGMRIREARAVLQRLLNIDPSAMPVINGVPVDEDHVIDDDVAMLHFVKPSSIKG